MGGQAAVADPDEDEARDDLFATRLKRLEKVTHLLIGARRDYAACLIAERQQKAEIYEANMHVSHGERQGMANAQTAPIGTEVLQLKANIEVLEDERRFLEFCITWDGG